MKVGILGSGMVGQNLAPAFVQTGHEIIIGTRNPNSEKIKEFIKELGSNIKVGTFEEAAMYGEIAIFAINWAGVENAIQLANPQNLAGKIVIDTTNPLDFSTGKLKLATKGDDSAGETVQRLLPSSKVVKAFNIIGATDMFKPQFVDGPPTMFISGNDQEAKNQVTELLHTFGWPDVINLGSMENSWYFESLLMVRMAYAMKNNSWMAPAFKFISQSI